MTPPEYQAARKLRGTQGAVAGLLGVNRVTIARRETGEQVITQEAWLALNALPKKRKSKTHADWLKKDEQLGRELETIASKLRP